MKKKIQFWSIFPPHTVGIVILYNWHATLYLPLHRCPYENRQTDNAFILFDPICLFSTADDHARMALNSQEEVKCACEEGNAEDRRLK